MCKLSLHYLDAVVAGGDLAVLDLHVGRGMGELAFGVLARAFVALELATDLQLQPARILAVEQAVHIDFCTSVQCPRAPPVA